MRTGFTFKTHWRRFVSYGTLLVLLLTASVVFTFHLIPGYDPYFAPREYATNHTFEEEGRVFLRGGEGRESAFDITQFKLNPVRLEYGVGRERIRALHSPAFRPGAGRTGLPGDSRVLLVRLEDEVRAYPLALLRWHEVVNDVVAGKALCVAFCPLADLAAVYEREIDGQTYTFAASGYTYYDWWYSRGYSTFVLWDRETESLWWPPMGGAVSGKKVGTELKTLDRAHWEETTWADAVARYPEIEVLWLNDSSL